MLTGYAINENEKVDLEGSISLTDFLRQTIAKTDNLFSEAVSAKKLKEQLFASIEITEGKVNNPVTCLLKIKDKKSGYTFETSIDLIVE
ncbi:MAG: hypothetical protein QNK89_03280 [Lacinutrix sp.]|uniref:hypothetical protein n=1 Tax=Lacinutrix sp. TaxID=1937692 RepID=UPI0030B6A866